MPDDFIDRLIDRARELQSDPRLRVGLALGEPLEEEAMQRIESAWSVDRFAPDLRAFYRRANGVAFFWIATHHPKYQERFDDRALDYWRAISGFTLPASTHDLPGSYEVEALFQDVPAGAIVLPPLEAVLDPERPWTRVDHGTHAEDAERSCYGQTWVGEALERAVRIFDISHPYHPAAFLMEPGEANPRVIVGEDHGAGWDASAVTRFGPWMERLLAASGRIEARRALLEAPEEEPPPLAIMIIDTVLPESVSLEAAEDGSTFEVEVVDLTEATPIQARANRIAQRHSSWYKAIARELDIPDRSDRPAVEVCADIARATADPAALDMALVRKLLSATRMRGPRTRKRLREIFFTEIEGGITARLRVRTTFNRRGVSAAETDANFAIAPLRAMIGERATLLTARCVHVSGRKQRTADIEVELDGEHQLEVGQTFTASTAPVGFRAHGDAIYRDLR